MPLIRKGVDFREVLPKGHILTCTWIRPVVNINLLMIILEVTTTK